MSSGVLPLILIGLTHGVTVVSLEDLQLLISMCLRFLLVLNTLLELPQVVHRGLPGHHRGKLKVFLLAHFFQVHKSWRILIFSIFA